MMTGVRKSRNLKAAELSQKIPSDGSSKMFLIVVTFQRTVVMTRTMGILMLHKQIRHGTVTNLTEITITMEEIVMTEQINVIFRIV